MLALISAHFVIQIRVVSEIPDDFSDHIRVVYNRV